MPERNELGSGLEKYRALIVEDEHRLLEHLSHILNGAGFSISACSSYRDLETLLEIVPSRFDIIVLDRLLHGRDSADLVSKFKLTLPNTRIMILSAINTASEKALLLDLGADDYLAKPFDSEELVARVRALVRRSSSILKFGNVTLDVLARTMKVAARFSDKKKNFAPGDPSLEVGLGLGDCSFRLRVGTRKRFSCSLTIFFF